MKKSPLALAVMLALGGCASPATQPELAAITEQAIISAESHNRSPRLNIIEENYAISDPIPATPSPVYGDISVNVHNQNFYDLAHAIAKQKNIILSVMPDVDTNRGISLNAEHLSAVAAIKRVARAAGYVAVHKPALNEIVIANRAVFSFKLPRTVMESLGDESIINVESESTDVSEVSVGTTNFQEEIADKLRNLAAIDSVEVFPASGIVIAEGDVHSLTVLHDFLNHYLALASAQLDIKCAIISVSLDETDTRGVDWTSIIGAEFPNDNQALTFDSSGVSLSVSTRQVSALITALAERRAIEVLAEPRISTVNLQTSALFSGDRQPYLASISSNVTDGVIVTERVAEYVNDGVLLQVTPDIIDKTNVQMRVQPSITSVEDFRVFGENENQITAPVESRSQTNSIVQLKSGETIIIGGIRSSNKSKATQSPAPTGLWEHSLSSLFNSQNNAEEQREFWVLLNVTINESAVTDALLSEQVAPDRSAANAQ